MKFQIYSRKSVFTGKGESVENQVEICKQYIFANFAGSREEEITVYEDEGFSGKNLERPQFQKMMRDLAADRPDCLVCYRLDRISRNVGDFASLIERLNRRDIAFVCVREKFDTGTPMGKAMMYIASVFAQLERETIAERVRDNMLMLAKTGRWLGGTTPTGFVSEKTREVIIDGKVKTACKLKAEPRETETVLLIYRTFLQARSLNGVRKYLHAHGIYARSGRDFSLPGLRALLQNPVYCTADEDALRYFTEKQADVCFTGADCQKRRGLLAYNKRDYTKGHVPRNPVEKWIVAAGRHEGLISGRDWVAAQAILAAGKEPEAGGAPRGEQALFSGRIYCAKCGAKLFAKSRSGRAGQYDYICQNKLQLGGEACACQNLGGTAADEAICRAIAPYLKPGGALERHLAELRRALAADGQKNADAARVQRVAACGREIENLVRVLADADPAGVLAQKAAARVAELEEEIRALEAAITGGERKQPAARRMTVCSFTDCFARMTVPEQRAILRQLVQKCEWDGETMRVYLYKT